MPILGLIHGRLCFTLLLLYRHLRLGRRASSLPWTANTCSESSPRDGIRQPGASFETILMQRSAHETCFGIGNQSQCPDVTSISHTISFKRSVVTCKKSAHVRLSTLAGFNLVKSVKACCNALQNPRTPVTRHKYFRIPHSPQSAFSSN